MIVYACSGTNRREKAYLCGILRIVFLSMNIAKARYENSFFSNMDLFFWTRGQEYNGCSAIA
jgi:hypothetical protein